MIARESWAVGADQQHALVIGMHGFKAVQHARAKIRADLLMYWRVELAAPALHGFVLNIVGDP